MPYVNADLDLNDLDTYDLIKHLENEGYVVYEAASPFLSEMQKLYELKQLGKEKEFEEAFRQLCWNSIGKIL